MKEEKTKVFFLTSINASLLEKKRFDFISDTTILSKSTKIDDIFQNQKKYFIYLNEFDVEPNLLKDENQEYIKINLAISNNSMENKNPLKYGIIINFTKNRTNFIFGLKIGGLINKTTLFEDKFDSCNIKFNLNFTYFHKNIMKMPPNIQPNYLENLGQDTISFLGRNKNEKLNINFEILFFLFLYSKEKKSDITNLLELIGKNSIEYIDLGIYKKEQVNDFIKEIFSNLENDGETWPFNYIGENNNEEKEVENEENKDLKVSKNEMLFIGFFLEYYSLKGQKEEDYKLFFMNERIKHKTIQTLSQIKKIKYNINISPQCRKEFMKLCDGKNDLLSKLQMETNILKYFELINEKFDDLFELIKKVGLSSFTVEYLTVKIEDDLQKIGTIHKEIISKEKKNNNFFLYFIKFIERSIEIFKDNDLNQLIFLISFIEDEKPFNNSEEYKKEINKIEVKLEKAINNTVNLYIKDTNKSGLYYLQIIPLIKKYFINFTEEEKFRLLEKANIGNIDREKETFKCKLKFIVENNLYLCFKNNNNKNYLKYFNAIIKNIRGITYLPDVLNIIPEVEYNSEIALRLLNWVSDNTHKYSSTIKSEHKQDFSKVLNILTYKRKDKIKEFLELLNKSLEEYIIIDFYIYFLENNKLEKIFKEELINYFIKHKKNIFKTTDSTIIPYILSKIKDKKDRDMIINSLKVIKEEEFYQYEINENIKLLNDLVQNNFFDKKNDKNVDDYTKKTINIISTIKSNFEKRTFVYEKALNIFNNFSRNNDPLYKMRLLFLSKEDKEKNVEKKALALFQLFHEDIMNIKQTISKLQEIKNYFETFFPDTKKKEVEKIKGLTISLNQIKLKDLNQIIETEDYHEIMRSQEMAEFYNKLYKSECFKQIYKEQFSLNKNKINGERVEEDKIPHLALTKFDKLKIIFETEKIENINENIKYLLDLALNDDNKILTDELLFLKNYFQINTNINQINQIKSNIILFARTHKINYILSGLRQIFNLFLEQIEKDEEMDNIKKIEQFLEDLKEENIEKKKIEEITSFLKEYNINLEEDKQNEITPGNNNIQDNKKNQDIFFEFMKLIQNNPEPIVFAKSKMEINAKLLMDFLVETDTKRNLQENDVQGFIKTVEFFGKYKEKKYKFSELIKQLYNILTDPKDEDYLGEFINKYIRNFNGIKTLYNDSINRSGTSSLIISLILANSEVKITHQSMSIEYHNREKAINKLDMEAIEELRGKALIMKSYMKKEKSEEKVLETNYIKVRKFVDLIQNFKTLNNYLNDLYIIGLPEPEQYLISIKIVKDKIQNIQRDDNENYDYSGIVCTMRGKEFKLKNLIEYLNNLKIEIQEMTEKYYLENEYLRLFYGKTFEYINRNLKLKSFDKLLPIFKSLSSDAISSIVKEYEYDNKSILKSTYYPKYNNIEEMDYFEIEEEENEQLEEEIKEEKEQPNVVIIENNNENNFLDNYDPIIFSFMNMMYNISEYCKLVFKQNKINSCEEIYKINLIREIKEKEKYTGVYISTTTGQNNDKKVFIFYKELSKSVPNRCSVLICSEDTTKEEIISFLFRVFLCPCQTLFLISKSDSLTKLNKIFLIEKINDFLKLYKNNMKSLLIIFHLAENSQIKKGFNNIKQVKVFQSKFENEINKKDYLDKIEKLKRVFVVESKKCGEGKSTYIKANIINSRKVYIYFQIGGVFTRQDLFERINKEIDLKHEHYLLHLDLTYTELNELVMEFLFKFLIMKYYDYDNYIFCYNPKKVEIYIEIHNEIYNYKEKYQILKFCQCKERKLSPLIEEDENLNEKKKKVIKDSKIQIVAQILKLLYEKKIGLKNINLNSEELLLLNKVEEKKPDKKDTSLKSCQELIDYYFNNNEDPDLEIKDPNHYQKKMFINLLSDQFTRFTESDVLFPGVLASNLTAKYNNFNLAKQKTEEIRELIINSLIDNVKLFVKGPYENLMKEQKETENYMISEEEQNKNEINKLVKNKLKTMITYDNIKQSIIAFDDNKSSKYFKIIPSSNCSDEEYKKLSELYNTQSFGGKAVLKKPKQKTETELLNDILDLCGAENELEEKKYREKIKEIYPSYVFTTDNYIKMVHILMKTRANIPIIMMGETGCGKTSLIKMLSLIKNKGKAMRMKILNIHQGVGDEEIISFLQNAMKETREEDELLMLEKKNNFLKNFKEQEELLKAKNNEAKDKKGNKKDKGKKNVKQDEAKNPKDDLALLEQRKKEGITEIEKEVQEMQMWIFFDEINTCNSLGLISEIFCNRTYRGNPIPDKYVFIGACNPYRLLLDQNQNLELGLELKSKKQKNLVYTVNPLPHSLLNYVIDFGELSPEDTKKYIESMIKKTIDDVKLRNLAVEVVKKCHLFIKEKGDSSSVSLRDIKYFNIFYKGFIKYFEYLKELAKKQNFGIKRKEEHLKDFIDIGYDSIKKLSINLSVYISYYLRLPTKPLREELCKLLDEQKYFDYGFLHVPEEESKYILNQIDINPDRGIAKNNALRENIFCEFFCLINKVPLIICGKPGNSKTLSVQLLLDSMKGKSSLNEFFKNPDYKEIMSYPFQGSTTCTSKGVLKTFEKARNFASKNQDMISLVFFDEMGLAEESSENPLKVLHAELEREDNKIAFFGLTNWILDASKMNRGIRIFVQEPDEEDLINTASEIAKAIDENIFKDNEELFIFLSKTYFKYRSDKAKTKYKDFHGNRDFYHLIKNTMKYLKEENEKDQQNDLDYIRNISAVKAIERNFGGYKDSVSDIKEIFYNISKYNNIYHRYNIIENISDNFKDAKSRYLLLISKNSTSQNLIEQIIQKEKKRSVIYIGSQFKGDKSESYTEEILYKIQMQMENEVILILKGLEIIYPSLYDLFNQNFSEFNGNRYAKISFSSNQSTSLINNKFKVVVLVDDQMILYEDKPFLNRFEKHVISFENILPQNYAKLVNDINLKIEELISYESNDEKKNIKINLKKQLISCDKEIIENLVFSLTEKNHNLSDEEITSQIFEMIAPTLTQDIIACININGFAERKREIAKIIETSYNKSYVPNIYAYFKKIPKIYLRHIIYTLSNITEPIFTDKEEEINSLFNKQNTMEIVVDTIETTKKLEYLIDSFYKSKNNLCIIKFEEEDLNKMNYIKNLIDNTEKVESTNNLKYLFFIVYMKRELIKPKSEIKDKEQNIKDKIIKDQIPLMDNFNQITIDNLNNENDSYNILDLTSNKDNNIINTLFNIDEIINNNIYDCFYKIQFLFKNKTKQININNYKQELCEGIIKNEYIMEKFKQLLIKNCKNINEIMTKVLTDSNCFHNDDVEFLSILKTYYKNEILLTLVKTIHVFEKNQILSSYILYYKEQYKKIIETFIENIDYDKIYHKKPLTVLLGIKVPGSPGSLKKIDLFIKNNIIEKYSENENLLRNDLPEDMDENEAKEKYEKEKEELENDTKNQIKSIKELNEILRINDLSIIKDFFNDLYLIFLSKYPSIPDTLVKFLDTLIQIYFLDMNSLSDENDFMTNYSEKLYLKHKNEIESNEFDDYFTDVVKVLLFLKNYSEYIHFIIEVYWEIYKFAPQVEKEFIQDFLNENFEHETSERCLEYFAVVNIKLFKIFESLIFSIKKILYFLCEKNEKVNDYIFFIKSNIVKLKQFNSEFSFYSKEIYTLQNLILAMNSFDKKEKKYDNEDLIQISKLFDNERKYINDNLQKELTENLEEIKKIFIKNLGEDSDEYSSLFISILLNEYRIFQNDEHRKKIIEMIYSNNNLIKKSIPILDIIFSGIEPDEEAENLIQENEDSNALIQNFMKPEENEENQMYKLIDENCNNTFNHILLFFFECKIENYFFKLKSRSEKNSVYIDKILNSSPFSFFKSILNTYITIHELTDQAYINLLKLYSIAYIKRYVTHYIDIKIEGEYDNDKLKTDMELNFDNNEENQPNEIKLVKIYMLKLLNQKGIDIYQDVLEVKHLSFLKGFLDNYREDKQNGNDNKNDPKDFCIFNLRQGYYYFNLDKQIDAVKKGEHELKNLIEDFYSLLANKYIPNYLKSKGEIKIDEDIKNYWKKIKEGNFNISPEIQNFYENLMSNNFYANLKSKLPTKYNFKDDKLYIILFILKFVLISIKNNKSNIFSSLLIKQKASKILKESFLPGIPLSMNSNYSIHFKELDMHLKTKKVKEGAYVCSCGNFYSILPCGFPTQLSECSCGQKIGGEHHKLFRRNGHMRIFLNDAARREQLSLSYADKTMPNMLLADYKKFVEEKEKQLIDKEQKVKLINQSDFVNPNQYLTERKIDDLTFRVLNFILYSHILYANIIGILTDNEIKCLEIEGMTIFNILEEDYKIILMIIKQLYILKDMKEFMNMVYYALEKYIEETEEIFSTRQKRETFEIKINNIINSSVKNTKNETYKKLKSNYKENIKNLNLNKKSLKIIIQQEYFPTETEYQNHPLFKELKYFMLSNCPSIDLLKNNFKNIIDAYKKYPVLDKILNNNHEIQLLQNIPILNEVSNSFRKFYSYNIERKEAKEKSVGTEKEKIINNIYNGDKQKYEYSMKRFEIGWNNIKERAIKFGCRMEMPVHEIKNYEDEKIAFFLVDKSDLYFGMYLSAAYDSLISIQSSFIDGIINFSNDNENDTIHKNYIKQLGKVINIQDAERKDIPKYCDEEQLNEIINSFSIRKCFTKDGLVTFNNYEGIEMNLDKIEENLCDYVLSQVKNFSENIFVVTYRFEGYRGNNSVIVSNYIEKYKPQRKLNSDELHAIFDYIENNKEIKHTDFLFDLQKIINFTLEENYKNEYSINDVINSMPEIIHLGTIKKFINSNNRKGKDNISLFTVNSLIDFYNLFEHLCWEEIKVNINVEFKKTLEEEKKQKIKKYFDNMGNNTIINKINLSTAIRRFISKYLTGLTQDSEKNENNPIMPELKRADLWDYGFTEHPYFENELEKIQKESDLTMCYILDLYELLGGDDSLLSQIKESVQISESRGNSKAQQGTIEKKESKEIGLENRRTKSAVIKKKKREKA